MKINPLDMYKDQTDKYKEFDENGIPTLDVAGKEINKVFITSKYVYRNCKQNW